MKISNLKINIMTALLLFSFLLHHNAFGAVLYNFDELPATAPNELPGSDSNFLYTTATNNANNNYTMTAYNLAGWRSIRPYPNTNNIYDFFHLYTCNANTGHMGYEAYGYLEIDNATKIKGNSLRYIITGGKNPSTLPGSNGLPLHTKKKYLDYLANSENPIDGGLKVGVPYLYFKNTSDKHNPVAFVQAQNTNRLSLYVKAPSSLKNGRGGYEHSPTATMHVGPYSNVTKDNVFSNGSTTQRMGGHWYHYIYTQGGGWTHIVVDAHPQHSNTFSNNASYPYPSRSVRDIGTAYFNNMWRLYVTYLPYSGIGIPPFSVWIDEMEFINDTEPQNNETINSPSVMYLPEKRSFEIGFNDKYKNNRYSWSTYEVRYSFSQITNANWSLATPVHIQADSRFGISASKDGKFKKWWPYYQAVWAPFKLASPDEAKLTPGTTVYFAIKDISQEGGDGKNPVGGNKNAGRRYAEFPKSFDYAGDKPALKLIKRIDYLIVEAGGVTDTTPPAPPKGLTVVH